MNTFKVPVQIGAMLGQMRSVEAMAGGRASLAVFPASFLTELGIEVTHKQRFEFADGTTRELDVGSARLKFGDLEVGGYASVVFGDEDMEPRLGRVTLASFCLEVDSEAHRLVSVAAKLFSPRLLEEWPRRGV